MIINKIFFKAPNSIVFSFTCTVESFVELAKFLLDKHRKDGLFLLSERLTQDPLENYFGQQGCEIILYTGWGLAEHAMPTGLKWALHHDEDEPLIICTEDVNQLSRLALCGNGFRIVLGDAKGDPIENALDLATENYHARYGFIGKWEFPFKSPE